MQHLDEGTIHAWLDGALSAEESERLEAHAASCAACGALVAEARGLIAASSRILAALDNVPREVIPPAATIGGAGPMAVTKPRLGPRVPVARIAAVVAFVAVGGMALRIAIGGSGPAVVASEAVKQEQLGAGDTMGAPMAPPPAAAVSVPASDSTAFSAPAPEVAAAPQSVRNPLPAPRAAASSARGNQAARRDEEGTALAGGRGRAPRDEQSQNSTALKAQASGFTDARRDVARQRLVREKDAAAFVVPRAAAPARSAIEGLTLVSRTTEVVDGREIETSVYDYRPGIQVMLRVGSLIGARPQTDRVMMRGARANEQPRRTEDHPVAAPAPPPRELREPIVERAGIRTLRWTDADGSEFTLSGALSEQELRALRERLP